MSWSRFVPYLPFLHTVTLLSFYRFFVSIQPISVVQERFWISIFFYSGVADSHFQFSFGLFYFLLFIGRFCHSFCLYLHYFS